MNKIIIKNLTKEYKNSNVRIQALPRLNFQIEANEYVILRGANGIGKSTLMKILATLIKPTSGSVHIFGETLKNPRNIRKKIGYIPENVNFDIDLNPLKFWQLYSSLSGRDEIDFQLFQEYIKLLNMEKWVNTSIRAFSLGMKKRLLLAFWLSLKPELLLLDEFESGVDEEGKKTALHLLGNIEGLTIIAVSHNQDFTFGKRSREVNFIDLIEVD